MISAAYSHLADLVEKVTILSASQIRDIALRTLDQVRDKIQNDPLWVDDLFNDMRQAEPIVIESSESFLDDD